MAEKIKLNIQLQRVLDVLCSQIYDSPLALLRENVQNAYDAVLMRSSLVGSDTPFRPCIIVRVGDGMITIEDNGIGMNQDTLKTNFWSAGSSGKNNETARMAGVVGTFGIGAMANFGVCSELKVITRAYGSEKTYVSWVKKSELSITDDCIQIEESNEQRNDYGTTVVAVLDNGIEIDELTAQQYLSNYVGYLPTPVFLNDRIISQSTYKVEGERMINGTYIKGFLQFDYKIGYNSISSNVSPQLEITNIYIQRNPLKGNLYLSQKFRVLYGMRNFFGLAPIPLNSAFDLGGLANLSTLVPTAGREAVSRESVDQVAYIIRLVEEFLAEVLSSDENAADNSRELINYIRTYGRYDLADNICIGTGDDQNTRYRLGQCKDSILGKNLYYYEGNDKETWQRFFGNNNIVLLPANDRVRRQVQLEMLKRNGVHSIPDSVDATRIDMQDLTVPELSIASRVKLVLQDDYFMPNAEVFIASITHKVEYLVKQEDGTVRVYLDRKASDVLYLTKMYEQDYSFFEPMVKDFVRSKLYTKLSPFVPNSVRNGADALYNILQRKRELYVIESTEMGEMDEALKEYMAGKTTFKKVLEIAKTIKNSQTINVETQQVGDISRAFEQHLDRLESKTTQEERRTSDEIISPLPPILRDDIKIPYKILVDKTGQSTINGYSTFLALSDKLYKQYYEFFLYPHSTRVIWSMHKIIYIFSHESGRMTLYYDIDLDKQLNEHSTGGKEVVTSTIVTKDKIFVPVMPELAYYFNLISGSLKLSVKFDSVDR